MDIDDIIKLGKEYRKFGIPNRICVCGRTILPMVSKSAPIGEDGAHDGNAEIEEDLNWTNKRCNFCKTFYGGK